MARGRLEDALNRTTYFEPDPNGAGSPPGSLVVMLDERRRVDALAASGHWEPAARVTDVDRRVAAVILRRAK